MAARRWCYKCGDWCVVGRHRPDGSLDVDSVMDVTGYAVQAPLGMNRHRAAYIIRRQLYARALGLHIGTRKDWRL